MFPDQSGVVAHDTWWPTSVAAMLGCAVLLILGASQLISPTRRWRFPRRRPRAGPMALRATAAATTPDPASPDARPVGADPVEPEAATLGGEST